MPEDKVIVLFHWVSTMPNTKQYEQNSEVLEPVDTKVAVAVPVNMKYLHNWDDIQTAVLSNESLKVTPILTPAGMKYCVDQLETPFGGDVAQPNDFKSTEEDWESEPEPKKNSTDSWEDAIDIDKPGASDEAWTETEESWEEVKE